MRAAGMSAASPGSQAANLSRVLGLAFAAAELLFEVGPDGRICTMIGAARALLGADEAEWRGWHWSALFESQDHMLIRATFEALAELGQRRTVDVRLAARKDQAPKGVRLSACRLLEASDRISCAVIPKLQGSGVSGLPMSPLGLMSTEGLLQALGGMLARPDGVGAKAQLEFVELGGLDAGLSRASPEAADAVQARIVGALRAASLHGSGAAQVGVDKFALIRTEDLQSGPLLASFSRAAEQAGLKITAAVASLSLDTAHPDASLKALRHALDRYMVEGPSEAAETFAGALRRTVEQRISFKAAVERRDFELVFQPVVSLKDRRLHHVEALARFEDGRSPATAIRLAEDLDMIHDFDLAVADAACLELAADPSLGSGAVAINLSGRSLTTPIVMDRLIKMLRDQVALPSRILVEITETAVMEDLDLADRQVQRLRRLGVEVCLDDFGAGAATFEYLRRLTLDVVKIDGRFVTNLNGDSRDRLLLKHMVDLCRALGLRTVAEMVETEAVAELVTGLGVDLGQGWLFGRPRAARGRQAAKVQATERQSWR